MRKSKKTQKEEGRSGRRRRLAKKTNTRGEEEKRTRTRKGRFESFEDLRRTAARHFFAC